MQPMNQFQPNGLLFYPPTPVFVPVPCGFPSNQPQIPRQNYAEANMAQAMRTKLHELVQENMIKQKEITELKEELLKSGTTIANLKSQNQVLQQVKEKFLKMLECGKETMHTTILSKEQIIKQLNQQMAVREKEMMENREELQQKIEILEKQLKAVTDLLNPEVERLEKHQESHTVFKEKIEKHVLVISYHGDQMYEQYYKKNCALLGKFKKDLEALSPTSRRYQAATVIVDSIQKRLKLIGESRKEFQLALEAVLVKLTKDPTLAPDQKCKLPASSCSSVEKKPGSRFNDSSSKEE